MKSYKQRSTYDCLLACIATVTQKDYDELWSEDYRRAAETGKGIYGDNVDKAFFHAGLSKNADYWTVYIQQDIAARETLRALLRGRRAILQVPSLNHHGAYHLVAWMGETLYDPSQKQVYQWIEQCTPSVVWVFNECVERDAALKEGG